MAPRDDSGRRLERAATAQYGAGVTRGSDDRRAGDGHPAPQVTPPGATDAQPAEDGGDPGGDATWLSAFLLAHRGKVYRLDGAQGGRGLPPASVPVPTDLVDDVVRAAGASGSAPGGRSA